jgi:hypothetical protein
MSKHILNTLGMISQTELDVSIADHLKVWRSIMSNPAVSLEAKQAAKKIIFLILSLYVDCIMTQHTGQTPENTKPYLNL